MKVVGGLVKLFVVFLEEVWFLYGDCEIDVEEGIFLIVLVVVDVRKS